ncbi:MAG: hypothetical protein H0Z40_12140 [Desulfotomaculum sp.]|nr:hypothetical protein [Desulfotomaculum sp.]
MWIIKLLLQPWIIARRTNFTVPRISRMLWRTLYFTDQDTTVTQVAAAEESDIKMLDEKDLLNLKIKPQTRDVKVYQQITSGEMSCSN